MENEESIERMLEESRRSGGRQTAAEIEALVGNLGNRRWRRRANRLCNLLGIVVVVAVAGLAVAWVPSPEYDSYVCRQADASPSADCQVLHQMLSQR